MAWVSFAFECFFRFRKLQRIDFAVGFHSLGDFVPMHGNFVRCIDAEANFVAGNAENLNADAECGKDDFVVAATREN